ncbi:MAG TPA: sensor domain-containing diguanylate cyclase, partial [Nevskiaceae bacterium]|nr:sensor domain-containing diguanylate cyclase [Nevskiaceae bacterium]
MHPLSATESLLDQLPVGAFRLDGGLREMYVNRLMAEFTGLPHGRIDTARLASLPLPGDLRKKWLAASQAALRDGATQIIEFTYPLGDAIKQVSLRIAPERGAGGAISGVLGTAMDISQLRRTEDALRESERRFEAFMDHTPAIAWMKDPQGRYIYRNKAFRDRYGEPGEDWSGRSDDDFFAPEDAAMFASTDLSVIATGKPVQFETSSSDRQGRSSDWLIQKFPLRDSSGRFFVGGVGVLIDERKRLEQALAESESRFQAFLDHSPTLSWMKDEDGRYLYVSETYKQFLGIDDDRWRGKTDFDLFDRHFAQRCRELELKVLADGISLETDGPAPDARGGEHHWLLVRFLFRDIAGGRFVGGVATDVTRRQRAEELVRLQSLTDEMTGLYNRRGFKLLVEQELRHVRRQREHCALLYVDLDGLKGINSAHGHEGGDSAIVTVAEALRVAVRNSDIVARVGGDEFVVILVDTDADQAQAIADRLRESGAHSAPVPFSLGW